jgi:carboxymethylenebutenolidase
MSTQDDKSMSNLWDQHLAAEFGAKSTEQALSTMGPNPSVNMVPLMIGARGRAQLQEFYSKHFLNQIPPDLETMPVSRTVGQGSIVDEFVARFTHTIRMDWLLPGVAPTGKRIEIPTVIIIQFEEGKIVSERIYWDQASVLVQIGLIDRSLPVLGAEMAQQVIQPTQPMNALIHRAQKG